MSIIEARNELEEAVRFAMTGSADPAVLERITEQCMRIQEGVRKQVGDRELSVELIRDIRDEDE